MRILRVILLLSLLAPGASSWAQEATAPLCMSHLREQLIFDLQANVQKAVSLSQGSLTNLDRHQLRYSRILLGILNALKLGKVTPTSTALKSPFSSLPELSRLGLDERITVSDILRELEAFGGRQGLSSKAFAQYQKLISENPMLAFIRQQNASDLKFAIQEYQQTVANQVQTLRAVDSHSLSAGALTLFAKSVDQVATQFPGCDSVLKEQKEKYLLFTKNRPIPLGVMAALAGACGIGAILTDGILGVVCGPHAVVGLGYSIQVSLEGHQEADILATALFSGQLQLAEDTPEETFLRYKAFAESALMSSGIPNRSGPL